MPCLQGGGWGRSTGDESQLVPLSDRGVSSLLGEMEASLWEEENFLAADGKEETSAHREPHGRTRPALRKRCCCAWPSEHFQGWSCHCGEIL